MSDWSSDGALPIFHLGGDALQQPHQFLRIGRRVVDALQHDVFEGDAARVAEPRIFGAGTQQLGNRVFAVQRHDLVADVVAYRMQRSEEHTSELQSLMRISYAVFCLKKKK